MVSSFDIAHSDGNADASFKLRQIIRFRFQAFDFDAFSSREPVSASLENALSPPRCRRRQAEAAAEAAVEIGQIVEAAIEGDVADAPLTRMRQQVRRLAQPQFQ